MKITDEMIKDGATISCSPDKYLPQQEEIPEDFKGFYTDSPWAELFADWFFKGLKDLKVCINPELNSNQKDILAFLNPIMRSYKSSHQHKKAGVSYLMSLIFLEAQWTPKETIISKTTMRDQLNIMVTHAVMWSKREF